MLAKIFWIFFLSFFFVLLIISIIWPKFCPKDHTYFTFFDWFPMEYVRGNNYIILITCVAIQQFWKKLVKPLKSCFFGPNLHRKGVIMATPNMEKIFLTEIKADHQLSESFYFIKIYVLTELWIFFYLEWYFLPKKCHFQLKQLWKELPGDVSVGKICKFVFCKLHKIMSHPKLPVINYTII